MDQQVKEIPRSWREIAREIVRETDQIRISQLLYELVDAVEQQFRDESWDPDHSHPPPVAVGPLTASPGSASWQVLPPARRTARGGDPPNVSSLQSL